MCFLRILNLLYLEKYLIVEKLYQHRLELQKMRESKYEITHQRYEVQILLMIN